MKKPRRSDYTAFQDSVLDKLKDTAEYETQRILRVARVRPMSDEDSETLKATDVAGDSWLKNDFGKTPK
jgi:hypothetical protein